MSKWHSHVHECPRAQWDLNQSPAGMVPQKMSALDDIESNQENTQSSVLSLKNVFIALGSVTAIAFVVFAAYRHFGASESAIVTKVQETLSTGSNNDGQSNLTEDSDEDALFGENELLSDHENSNNVKPVLQTPKDNFLSTRPRINIYESHCESDNDALLKIFDQNGGELSRGKSQASIHNKNSDASPSSDHDDSNAQHPANQANFVSNIEEIDPAAKTVHEQTENYNEGTSDVEQESEEIVTNPEHSAQEPPNHTLDNENGNIGSENGENEALPEGNVLIEKSGLNHEDFKDEDASIDQLFDDIHSARMNDFANQIENLVPNVPESIFANNSSNQASSIEAQQSHSLISSHANDTLDSISSLMLFTYEKRVLSLDPLKQPEFEVKTLAKTKRKIRGEIQLSKDGKTLYLQDDIVKRAIDGVEIKYLSDLHLSDYFASPFILRNPDQNSILFTSAGDKIRLCALGNENSLIKDYEDKCKLDDYPCVKAQSSDGSKLLYQCSLSDILFLKDLDHPDVEDKELFALNDIDDVIFSPDGTKVIKYGKYREDDTNQWTIIDISGSNTEITVNFNMNMKGIESHSFSIDNLYILIHPNEYEPKFELVKIDFNQLLRSAAERAVYNISPENISKFSLTSKRSTLYPTN